jgi:hypothetical protein
MEPEKKPKKQQKTRRPALKAPHTEELVDHYWGSVSYVSDLIKASEIKAGLILSFYGILLNFIYQGTGTLLESKSGDSVLYILIGLWLVCTAVSIFFCIRCFIPKMEGKFSPNVFFFGDVISKFGDVKEFSETFYKVSLDEKELFSQLGEQIFIISKIAAWKFKNVRRAVSFLGIGLFLLFATAGYYGISLLAA